MNFKKEIIALVVTYLLIALTCAGIVFFVYKATEDITINSVTKEVMQVIDEVEEAIEEYEEEKED